MNRSIHNVITGSTLALVMLAGTAVGDQIYRSVDAEGNVTFSSQPPAGAVNVDEVNVQPGPSAAAQRAARERMQAQEATANEMSEARANRAQQEPEAAPAEPYVEEPVNQFYGYPDGNYPRGDQVPGRLPGRPVTLPARPVQLPARPVMR
jgi:Domain of unknown function (DUF4124)